MGRKREGQALTGSGSEEYGCCHGDLHATHQQDPVGTQEPMGHYWSHWTGLLPYPTTEWGEWTMNVHQESGVHTGGVVHANGRG